MITHGISEGGSASVVPFRWHLVRFHTFCLWSRPFPRIPPTYSYRVSLSTFPPFQSHQNPLPNNGPSLYSIQVQWVTLIDNFHCHSSYGSFMKNVNSTDIMLLDFTLFPHSHFVTSFELVGIQTYGLLSFLQSFQKCIWWTLLFVTIRKVILISPKRFVEPVFFFISFFSNLFGSFCLLFNVL